MKTRSESTTSGEGATARLNLNGKCHSSLPSAAATPTVPSRTLKRYCLTPPSRAGISEECDSSQPSGFGVRQSSLPVALSSATMRADVPTGAITIRSFSISGFWPLYQGGIFVLYSCTRFLRQSCLPVVASRQCRTALGSSEKTYLPSMAGTVRVMAWFGRMRRLSWKRQSSLPSASDRQRTSHSDVASS